MAQPDVRTYIESGVLKPGDMNKPLGGTLYGTWANGVAGLSQMVGPGQFVGVSTLPVPTPRTTGGAAFPAWFGGWDPNQPMVGAPPGPVRQALAGWSPWARGSSTNSLAGSIGPPVGFIPPSSVPPWETNPNIRNLGLEINWQPAGGQFPGAGVPGYNGGEPAGWRPMVPTGGTSFLSGLMSGLPGMFGSIALGGAVAPALGALSSAVPALGAILNSPVMQAVSTLMRMYQLVQAGMGGVSALSGNRARGPLVNAGRLLGLAR